MGFGGYEISFYQKTKQKKVYKKHLTVGCFYSQWKLCNKNIHLFLVHPGFHYYELRIKYMAKKKILVIYPNFKK